MAVGPQLNPLAAYREGYNFEDQRRRNALADQEQARQQQLRMSVGGQIAQGDLSGARQAAAQGGQFEWLAQIDQMDENQRAYAAEVADLGYQIADRLKSIPDPQQRAAAFQNAAPRLVKEYGLKPEQLPTDFSDQGLTTLMQSYDLMRKRAKPQAFQSGRYVRGIDPNTGEQVYSVDLPQDELDAEYRRAQIEATKALVGQRGASAEASRARAAKTRSGPAAPAAKLPPGFILD